MGSYRVKRLVGLWATAFVLTLWLRELPLRRTLPSGRGAAEGWAWMSRRRQWLPRRH